MTHKPLVYIAEPNEISQPALGLLTDTYHLIQGEPTCTRQVVPYIRGLIIRSRTQVTRLVLDRFPELEFIIRIGVGLDSIDVAETDRRGISIYNAPGSNAHAVAEYVIGMMLTAARRWHQLNPHDLTHWNRHTFLGHQLTGKTIGIVGFGHIGKLVYRKLLSWQTNFLVHDPYLTTHDLHYFSLKFTDSLEHVLTDADIVTLHLPLTPDTHHLLNYERLMRMKPGHMLINAARGGIVDETAILAVVDRKQSLYVADVFEHEPIIPAGFIDHPRIIATPHIAAMTQEANQAMAVEAITNFLEHRPSARPPAATAPRPTATTAP